VRSTSGQDGVGRGIPPSLKARSLVRRAGIRIGHRQWKCAGWINHSQRIRENQTKRRCDAELLLFSDTFATDAVFCKAGARTVQSPHFDSNHHLPRGSVKKVLPNPIGVLGNRGVAPATVGHESRAHVDRVLPGYCWLAQPSFADGLARRSNAAHRPWPA
jgi:hypothetical protein